jgi:hypothetical protein
MILKKRPASPCRTGGGRRLVPPDIPTFLEGRVPVHPPRPRPDRPQSRHRGCRGKLRAKSFAPTQMGDAGPCGGGRCGRDFHDAANDLHRRTPSYESRGHSESAAKLLIENEASREVLTECALIRKADKLDFGSAIPKFESWRPSQPPGSLAEIPRRFGNRRYFRRLAARSPVSSEGYRTSHAKRQEFGGESLLDEFSISEIQERRAVRPVAFWRRQDRHRVRVLRARRVKNGTPTHRLDCWLDSADTAAMGVRTRGTDIIISAKR